MWEDGYCGILWDVTVRMHVNDTWTMMKCNPFEDNATIKQKRRSRFVALPVPSQLFPLFLLRFL